mmetsp:Transcript_43176/g.31543  ORF Transcript_43176/g.31543 Transcript_43176/m.31543 type:complete len:88 (-) Transcript_43176:157-420(-)
MLSFNQWSYLKVSFNFFFGLDPVDREGKNSRLKILVLLKFEERTVRKVSIFKKNIVDVGREVVVEGVGHSERDRVSQCSRSELSINY